MEFDGTNDYINVPYNANLNFGTDNFSISLWYKTDVELSSSNEQSILRKDDLGGSPRRFYQIVHGDEGGPDEIYFMTYDSSISGDTDKANIVSTSVNDGNWHHVVGLRDGTSLKLYFDGKLAGTDTDEQRNVNNTHDLKLGTIDELGSYFNGLIDDVYIYNYALSADEINTLYNQGQAAVMGDDASRDNDGTAVTGKSKEYCIPGDTAQCDPPVLELNFEEAKGTTTTIRADTAMTVYLRPPALPPAGTGKARSAMRFYLMEWMIMWNATTTRPLT